MLFYEKLQIMNIIYKLTSPNGSVYIGQTKNYLKRMRAYEIVNQNHTRQHKLFSSIVKYGWDNFTKEIIEEIEDTTKVDEREIYWIAHYKSNYKKYPEEGGLNLTDGGKGVVGYTYDLKSKFKMSQAHKAVRTVIDMDTGIFFDSLTDAAKAYNVTNSTTRNWSLGKSINSRKNIFLAKDAQEMLLKLKSGEFNKAKKQRVRRYLSEADRQKLSLRLKNIPLTEEHKAKLRKPKSGYFKRGVQTKEHILKLRESSKTKKVIIQKDENRNIISYHPSIRSLTKIFGEHCRINIRRAIQNNTISYGFRWELAP